MNTAEEFGREAERLIIDRLNQFNSGPNADSLNFFLDLARRFLSGERDGLGRYIDGQFYYSWLEHGPELNNIYSRFATLAKKEDPMPGKNS
jgi:hypothetical protein